VGSSWTRDQTCVPCIERQILNYWTTREVPRKAFSKKKKTQKVFSKKKKKTGHPEKGVSLRFAQ